MGHEDAQVSKPLVFLKSITFNDGTLLNLNHNSIVVFTGANNSGKSQVLKDVENFMAAIPAVVITDCEFEYSGTIDEPRFLNEHFSVNDHGDYCLYGVAGFYSLDVLHILWSNHKLSNNLHLLFARRLSTELRLTVSNDLRRDNHPERNPIYKLSKSDTLAQKISDYFHQAFGVDLVINRNEMQTIPLHVGTAPDKTAFTMNEYDDYYNCISALPKLQKQGDGMRSFASILLDMFTTDYTITLIDEPEAFLHPPQARLLGKMLATNNPEGKQLLISTHSEDFLQGLLDADNENVTVIRINRVADINKMSILESTGIKTLWGNPLLRYSNILSGLFHEKVIVCESDYDCLFYQAVMDAMYESKGEIAPDVLFTHCGGKNRIKDVLNEINAVNVTVVEICYFDLLDESNNFKPIVASFGVDWDSALSKDMKTIYDRMHAKGANAWSQIKKVGKVGFDGDAPAAYEKVESICREAGLFVVPVGEMECFDKTINREKKEWVYYVLENYDLATEPKLEEARRFIQEIVDYTLLS